MTDEEIRCESEALMGRLWNVTAGVPLARVLSVVPLFLAAAIQLNAPDAASRDAVADAVCAILREHLHTPLYTALGEPNHD